MEKVIYLRNKNYPYLFCGSNGLIWSCKSNKFLGTLNKRGYITITLNCGKKLKNHRLIMECFKGISNLCVDHIDGNKTNNHIENLEYVSAGENTKRAHKLGLIKQSGEDSSTCKISNDIVNKIRLTNIKGKKEKAEHAKSLGISIGYYYRVLRGEVRP